MGKTAILVVLAATLGSTMLMFNAKDSVFEAERRQVDYQEEQLAKEIARAGYNLAVGQVKRDFETYRDISEESVAYQNGRYELAASGENKKAAVASTGYYDDKDYSIEGVLELTYAPNAAVYIDGSSVSADYYGNSFAISGQDTPPPSATGTRSETELSTTSRAVVAREQSVADAMLDGLGHMQHDNVYGQQPEDDIYQGKPYLDLELLVDRVKDNPDEVYEGDQMFNGNKSFGSADNVSIVLVEGNATVNGNVKGYGVLLVEGDLSLAAGNFTWEGLVMAYGDVGVEVDYTGNTKLYGSLIVIPDQFDEPNDGTVDFEIGGNAEIYYSSEAIERIAPELVMNDEFEHVVLLSENAE